MTAFPRISTTKIGANKDAPRVWLEGRYLLDAGFAPATRVEIEFSENKAVIRPATDGPRVISSKRRNQKEIPVLDINSAALAKTFGNITALQVYITEGQITLSPTHTEALRASRCRNGKEGSVFSGGGLLSEAASQAGYEPAFAVEIDDQYAAIFEANHPQAQMRNLSVEDLPIDSLPQVELLTLGIPCQPFSRARTKDLVTGNKRDRSLPPEAHPLSDMTLWAAMCIRATNPATVVIEQAPGYLTSAAGYMMQHFLKRAGYTVEARVIDPRHYGELTARIRTVIVAHSGQGFQWPDEITSPRTFAEIRDDETDNEDAYFTPETKSWLTTHWANQTAKGNGFASAQLDDHSTSVPCINLRYLSQQGSGTVVKHRTKSNCWRWLSLNELRKLHGIPDNYYLGEEESKTRAGELIGQGVIITLFQKIIAATKNIGKTIGSQPLREVRTHSLTQEMTSPDPNQLGLVFA